MALYLGARLLVKQLDKRNEPAETALLKLAQALRDNAGVGKEIYQATQELVRRPVREGYQPIFRNMVRAYIYRKKVRICYKPLNWEKSFQTTFSTYLIEPSLIGSAIYLIGHSSIVDALRAYKLERIQAAEITRQDYTIPEDFPGLAILRNAWNIMTGEELTRVVLRFSPRVRERVEETIWHPSQNLSEDPEKEGHLRWTAEIANTQDILPWIRSWGADCEVVKPPKLRRRLKREARLMGKTYQVFFLSETKPRYYAHSRPDADEEEWQLLKDHLTATAELAADLGRPAGLSELARVAGLLHDVGKYAPEFQERLRGASKPVDHATAGAREIVQRFADTPQKPLAELISFAIAGHHTGLPDYGSMGDMPGDGTLLARREKKNLKDYSAYKTEIDVTPIRLKSPQINPVCFRMEDKEEPYPGFSVAFMTRMLFSTLVDADWLDTERFMEDHDKPRGKYASIPELAAQFNQFLKRFENPTSEINHKRTETLHACVEKSAQPPGFFTLTVPTGGGKTFASMAFALNHAARHGLRRVIYVIPFTSIIEQNAEKFREALGPLGTENVLEHHSNFDWERAKTSDDETNQVAQKLKLAAENWDIPIVVTTSVQFFESLFASRKRQTRKLHNIAQSVIIFDEVQTLPREYLKPSLLAVQELVQNYGCSAVFCTATQPALDRFFPQNVTFTELAPQPKALYQFYRRVEVKNLGKLADEDLLDRLNGHEQVLCIVNTRRHAKGLYSGLHDEGRFHLSTLMCPVHRRQVLAEIHRRLADGRPCQVVSTQVMEAGIDIDFPVGYRALAGLDSVIQAAGRVNREMRQPSGEMFVFTPETESIKRTPAFIAQTGAVARSILREHSEDPASLEAIAAYYEMLYTLQDKDAFDARRITECFEKSRTRPDFDFKTAAERFRFIEQNTVPVLIPYDERAHTLLHQLQGALYPASTLRKLQIYTVNIYEREFERLQSKGVVLTVAETYHVLDEERMAQFYSSETGLLLPEESGGDAIFFDG
jgi:CRISPR-associated endonuclease/helicase Cas3